MSVLVILLCLMGLWLFAIMPRMTDRPDRTPFMNWYYAHRGLHDNQSDAPENSLAAFAVAVEAGYGIELDVQLTKDRIPVVFHDETLKRVCDVEGKVRDYTYEQLRQFSLCGSMERIPLFSDVLKLVDGKVPLIVEIKIHENADKVCAAANEVLKGYTGMYCIESFHPFAVRWFRRNRPEVLRGQLSSNFAKTEKKEDFGMLLVHHLLTNFLSRPDFIAYDHRFKTNPSRVLCSRLFGVLDVTWTIRSQKELDEARRDFDLFIFEGFCPDKG